ncbi:MAG: DNA-primase RepB domain-containing protein [Acidobacteria bacterium]|nr:DNA-primase RepB domain-containing protein [Acidobacteriota bacterium]
MPNRTEIAVRQHLAAIQSPLYEIGVFFAGTETGKDSKMLLRTWDVAAVLKSIPWLRAKNANGAAIYVRPKGEHAFSLVDDLTAEAVARMKAEGFTPAIVVETSPHNFQAWLNHGEALDKRTSTAAARALADRFGGDPGAADWRHFGRLSAFTNRKASYLRSDGLFPFVRTVELESDVYAEAHNFIAGIRQTLREQPSTAHVNSPLPMNRRLKSIEEFRADPAYRGDGNRIDLAYAIHALAHGASEDSIRAAILTRDLLKKGPEARQLDYVVRTVSKALAIRAMRSR